MKRRHINLLMLIFSIIGGIMGYIVGEILINLFMYRIPNVLLVGMYFAVFAACVSFMCFLAERIKPRLTGSKWLTDCFKMNLLIVIPLIAVGMFVTGCVTQFIYGLNTKSTQKPNYDDYVFLMDNSGSMQSSDPQELRISQIDQLIDELDETKRIGYYAFSSTPDKAFSLQKANAGAKQKMHKAIMNTVSDGGTDIELALNTAINDIKPKLDPNRTTAIILISDGEDEFDTTPIVNECKANKVIIDCIGLGISVFSSGDIMNKLADGTGGNFYDIQSADQIIGVFTNIKNHNTSTRLLLERRFSTERVSPLFGIERVLFISLFGVLLGLGLGLLFDNKQLFKNLMIGGAVTGVLAGLLMELGLCAYMNSRFCRLGMDILLSLVVCLFTAVIAYEITNEFNYSGGKIGGMFGNSGAYGTGVPSQFGNQENDNNYFKKQF